MEFSFGRYAILLLLVNCHLRGQDLLINQHITCIDKSRNYLYEIDLKHAKVTRFDSNGNRQEGPLEYKNIKIDDVPSVFVNNYFPINSYLFLITLGGTGQVYLFDSKHQKIERIDKTFYRGNNFGAIQFSRKDTIFSVGGKGFWRIHNIPNFFNHKSKEWDFYNRINDDGPKGISEQFGGYDPTSDCMYSLELPPLYTEKTDNQYPFYTYNFNSSSWKETGIVNFENPNLKKFNKQQCRWVAPFFFSQEAALEEFIDPAENKIYRYKGNNRSFFLLTTHLYIKGKRIYAFQRTYNQNKFEIKLDSMDIDSLKKASIVLGDFYLPNVWYNKINWANWLNFTLVCIILILVYIVFHQIGNKKQKSRTIWNQLPKEGISILQFMLRKKDYMCTSDELNELIGCAEKSIESQRQYRSKFILSINHFFERNFELSDAIFRNQSETDKRYVEYQLSREAVEISKHDAFENT